VFPKEMRKHDGNTDHFIFILQITSVAKHQKKKMDHQNNENELNTPALPCDSHVETKSDAGCERSC